MPDVTADTGEGVLAAWLVEESARFDAAQTIAYVETDDELFSVEAGRPGLLLKTLVEPGIRVAAGTPIGILGEPDEQVRDIAGVLGELGDSGDSGDSGVLGELGGAHAAESSEPSTPDQSSSSEPLAHHYLRARVRVDRLVAMAAQLDGGAGPGLTPLIVRAVTAAHRQVPQLAVAHLGDDRGAPAGIPVSDPGRFGVEEAAPVVPGDHAAALAIGAVREEPVVDAAGVGGVVPGKVLTLTLSLRPGRVDDVQASRWLAVLVALLERPEWLTD
jgi:pyruvate/2-oxoglutarate dehydrogenase complex dihydrolipoamide acyltransferase (E2) component